MSKDCNNVTIHVSRLPHVICKDVGKVTIEGMVQQCTVLIPRRLDSAEGYTDDTHDHSACGKLKGGTA